MPKEDLTEKQMIVIIQVETSIGVINELLDCVIFKIRPFNSYVKLI